MSLVYNSTVLADDALPLLPTDRAFQYGDGLFETIRYERGHVWFWPDHIARLQAGMAALHLTFPPDLTADVLYSQLLDLLARNGLTDTTARVKLQVWRQPGGLYTPVTSAINYLLTARAGLPFASTEKPKISIYDTFRLHDSPVSSLKTLNSLPYVLAGIYKSQQQLDDVLLLNTNGYLAECQAANLFWLTDNVLYTPSLRTGCVDGTARKQLLRLFPDAREGWYLPDVLATAAVVFSANVMGIQVFAGAFSTEQHHYIVQHFTDPAT
ncbi:aminotransferase class IV [Spirosoma rhododendri]|uniref:branched-chain-amino-acid transaminase n=1 Tax=Spirosoma rhododendri TaxID=2728024 RepID=A0A7L5DLY7_9BACT|nr:aminotransferase class IV [Spirosoma rhododendri]QJD77087.1 aminotransferase class IV [Spirosoma rhododendri]